jgi:putative ABC transport system permease protein
MPQGFRFPERGELWAPMSLDPAANTRTDYFLTAIARLKDGLTLAQASAEVQAVFAGIRRKYPEAATGVELSVLPLRDRLTADYSAVLVRLLVAVLLVLTIACTNVMNLLLARAAGRQREFAIRAALGANRRRVVRQLLTEALLLGAIGGVLGVVLGAAIIPALLRSSPVEIPYWISLQPDWRVIGFTTLVVVGASVFFGLAPALHATRVDLTSAVKQVGAGGAARPASRIRQGLVVAQLALSVVLLVGAGLMVRSLANLAKVDLGFRSDDVLTFQVALPNTRYAESSDRIQFFRRLMQELQGRPQVRAAGATAGLPLGDNWWRTFLREGETRTKLADLTPVRYVPVTGAYFAAMAIPVISGRAFTDTEGAASAPIIVSRNTAARFWPGQPCAPSERRPETPPDLISRPHFSSHGSARAFATDTRTGVDIRQHAGPSCRHSTRRTSRTQERTHAGLASRPAAGHARPADPSHPRPLAHARMGHLAADPAGVGRRAPRQPGLALPGAASAGRRRVD